MSEQPPKFNPQDHAKLIANDDQDLQRFNTALGDENGVVSPAAAQGFIDYTESASPKPVEADGFGPDMVINPNNGNAVKQTAYFDAKREEHFNETQSNEYEAMGLFELARELAQSELAEDKTKSTTLNDLLIEKWISESEKLTDTDETFKDPDFALRSREEKLWDRVVKYKDSYKDGLLNPKTGAIEKPSDIAEQVDPDRASFILHSLKDMNVPDEILQNLDPAYFYDTKNPNHKDINEQMPKELGDWFDANQNPGDPTTPKDKNGGDQKNDPLIDKTNDKRDRINYKTAEKWMNDLKNRGVPDEILQDFPAEFFYNDGDPDQIDDTPESFKQWLEENPDALKDGKEVNGEPNQPKSTENEQPAKKRSFRSKLTEFMTQDGAVTFDKKGNAIVNTDLEDWTEKKELWRKIALGAGAVALAGASYYLVKNGIPFNLGGGNHATNVATVNDVANAPNPTNHISPRHTAGGLPETIDHLKTMKLGSGETIWQYAEQALREQGIDSPTDTQVVKKTQSILMSNGLTWRDARSLPEGFKFNI